MWLMPIQQPEGHDSVMLVCVHIPVPAQSNQDFCQHILKFLIFSESFLTKPKNLPVMKKNYTYADIFQSPSDGSISSFGSAAARALVPPIWQSVQQLWKSCACEMLPVLQGKMLRQLEI